jgi:hypothetical protein
VKALVGWYCDFGYIQDILGKKKRYIGKPKWVLVANCPSLSEAQGTKHYFEVGLMGKQEDKTKTKASYMHPNIISTEALVPSN